jgi:uncharacterized membrane protein
MNHDDFSRRDFHKLALAAFGGVVAGTLVSRPGFAAADANNKAADKHACCGLNECKGQGAGGKNDCAGMGSCSTTTAHGCNGMNDCKGQGGSAANACKGQGSCSVPIKGDAWKQARTHYEKTMKKAGKTFGAAPATCGK